MLRKSKQVQKSLLHYKLCAKLSDIVKATWASHCYWNSTFVNAKTAIERTLMVNTTSGSTANSEHKRLDLLDLSLCL